MSFFIRKKYARSLMVATLVTVLPFVIYSHLWFDPDATYLTIFGQRYTFGYDGVDTLAWHILISVIPISLFLIWFLTTWHWWRYFILVPLITNVDYLVRHALYYREIIENNIVLFSSVVSSIFIIIILGYDRIIRKNVREMTPSLSRIKFKANARDFYGQSIDQIEMIKNKRLALVKTEYLKRLHHVQSILRDEIHRFGKRSLKSNKAADISIVFLLLFVPFLFYAFEWVPSGLQVYKNDWISIGSFGFVELSTFVWAMSVKLCTLIPLCIWFITCQYWWRYAILSPIIFTVYQIWELFQDSQKTDEASFFQALPWVLLVIVFLFGVSHVVKYRSKILDIHEEITLEIENLFSQLDLENMQISTQKTKFENLKKNRGGEKLDALLHLRKELLEELKADS